MCYFITPVFRSQLIDVFVEVGTQAPDFSLIADNGNLVTLSQLKGQKIVLYFYPKDDTSGCTQLVRNRPVTFVIIS